MSGTHRLLVTDDDDVFTSTPYASATDPTIIGRPATISTVEMTPVRRDTSNEPTVSIRPIVFSGVQAGGPDKTAPQWGVPCFPDDVDLPDLPWLSTRSRRDEWVAWFTAALETTKGDARAAMWRADTIGRAIYCRS